MCAGQDLIFPSLMHEPENQLCWGFFCHVSGDQNPASALTASIIVNMGLQTAKKLSKQQAQKEIKEISFRLVANSLKI